MNSVQAHSHGIFWMVMPLFQLSGSQSNFVDLGGNDWTATGSSQDSSFIMWIPKATVPGCVHTDWYNYIGHDKVHVSNPNYM